MRPTWTIEDIYETPARARVLRTLALATTPISVRGIASRAGVSHTAAGAVLRDLEAMRLVSLYLVGRAHVYALRRSNVYVRDMVLPAVEAESRIAEELQRDLIDEFAAGCLSLILYGSYAHGEQRETSDIDVFALVEDSRRKQMLDDRAAGCAGIFAEKYSAPLSLLTLTRSEAEIHLLGGKSSFGVELATTGIILHGLGVDEWGTKTAR